MDSSPPERNTSDARGSIIPDEDDFDFTEEKAENNSQESSGENSEFEKADETESQESQVYSEMSSISVIDTQSSSNNQSDFEDLEMSNVGDADDTSNHTFHTVNTTLTSQHSPTYSSSAENSTLYKSFQEGDSTLEDSYLVQDQTLENVSSADHHLEAVPAEDGQVQVLQAQDHFLGHLLDNVHEQRDHEGVHVHQDDGQGSPHHVEPIQNLLQDPDISIEDMIQDIRDESDVEDRDDMVEDRKASIVPHGSNNQEPAVRFIKREGDRIIIETSSPTSGRIIQDDFLVEEDNIVQADHSVEQNRIIVSNSGSTGSYQDNEAQQAWQQGNWEDQNPAISKLKKVEKIIVVLLSCCTLFHMIGNAFVWNFSYPGVTCDYKTCFLKGTWPTYTYLSTGALIIWIIVIACLFVQWNRTKLSGIQRTKFIFASPQIALIGTLIWAFGYILLLSCSNDLIDHTPVPLPYPIDNIYFQTYPFLYYSQMLVAFVSGILWVSAIISVQYQQRDGYYQIP